MKLITAQLKGNQRCAVLGRHADPRGFIHTRRTLNGWDPEVFVSVAAAEEMGRMIGMVTREEIQEHLRELKEMGDKLHDLQEYAAKLEAYKEARDDLVAA